MPERDIEAMKRELSRPFPDHLKKDRQGPGGRTFTYVGGEHYYQRVYDASDGEFSTHISHMAYFPPDAPMFATCVLTLEIPGLGARTGIGTAHLQGNPNKEWFKGAETDAFKRAARQFGVGSELYFEDDISDDFGAAGASGDGGRAQTPQRGQTTRHGPANQATAASGNGSFTPPPGTGYGQAGMARSQGRVTRNPDEPATAKQVKYLYDELDKLGWTVGQVMDEIAYKFNGKKPEELTKRQMSDQIDAVLRDRPRPGPRVPEPDRPAPEPVRRIVAPDRQREVSDALRIDDDKQGQEDAWDSILGLIMWDEPGDEEAAGAWGEALSLVEDAVDAFGREQGWRYVGLIEAAGDPEAVKTAQLSARERRCYGSGVHDSARGRKQQLEDRIARDYVAANVDAGRPPAEPDDIPF